MKRDVYIAKCSIVAAALAADSLYSAEDDDKEISSKDHGELTESLTKELSLNQLENLSCIVNRAMESHPRMKELETEDVISDSNDPDPTFDEDLENALKKRWQP